MSLTDLTLDDALEAIGAKTPTPGGGAVASITAALGAALARMVVNYSLGKPKLAEHAELHAESLESLEAISKRALTLAAEDEAAYGRLNALWKLPEDDPQRRAGWADAVAGAIDAPRRVLALSVELLELLDRLPGRTTKLLASDLAIAAVLAEAATRSAAWNVRINLPLTDDADALGRETAERIDRARALCASIEGRV